MFINTVLWILKPLWNVLSETTDFFFVFLLLQTTNIEKLTIDLCTYFRHFWTKFSQIINFIDIWKLLFCISLHDCFPVKSSNYFIAEELTNPLLNVLMHFDHLYIHVHVQDPWNDVIVQRAKLVCSRCGSVHRASESWFGSSFERQSILFIWINIKCPLKVYIISWWAQKGINSVQR